MPDISKQEEQIYSVGRQMMFEQKIIERKQDSFYLKKTFGVVLNSYLNQGKDPSESLVYAVKAYCPEITDTECSIICTVLEYFLALNPENTWFVDYIQKDRRVSVNTPIEEDYYKKDIERTLEDHKLK